MKTGALSLISCTLTITKASSARDLFATFSARTLNVNKDVFSRSSLTLVDIRPALGDTLNAALARLLPGAILYSTTALGPESASDACTQRTVVFSGSSS